MLDIYNRHKRIVIGLSSTIVLVLIIIFAVLLMRPNHSADHVILPGDSSGTAAVNASGGPVVIDYTEAPDHIGEQATVKGALIKAFTAKSGVTFLDFCQSFDSCPFSAVIFASDAAKFGDLSKYEGKNVELTGIIRSYSGQAEMVLSDPGQLQ